MMKKSIVVFITTKNTAEAETISRALLDAKLIACANIVDGIKSLFWWQGKIDESGEAFLMAKSHEELLPDIIRTVKKNHGYSVPEIIALPVIGGNPDYLKWIDQSVQS